MRTFRSAIILLVACGLPQYLRGEVHRGGIVAKPARDAVPASESPTRSRHVAIAGPSMILPVQALHAVSDPTGMIVSEPMPIAALSPIQFSRPFVHERQTVRVSERDAEIWVKLPAGSSSSVSVNFVEYPPEGEYRIFKTRLATPEPRRYYLSAKKYNGTSKSWDDLWSYCSAPGPGELRELSKTVIVDLTPGQRIEVAFECQVPAPTLVAPPSPAPDPRIGEINENVNQINKTVAEIAESLQANLDNIEGRLQNLEQPQEPTPHPNSSKVTRMFRFDGSTTTLHGRSSVTNDQIKSVHWTVPPAPVVFAVPRTVRAAPTSAEITLTVTRDGKPIATLKPLAVDFVTSGESYVTEISFPQRIEGPLTEALRVHKQTPGELQITAEIDYVVDLGLVEGVRIAGPIENSIKMTID